MELSRDIRRAASSLRSGGVIAYPSDTVYGLGCLPTDTAALKKILAIKQRSVDKGLILLAANRAQLASFTDSGLTEANWQTICADQAQPTTWLVPAAEDISPLLCGSHTTIAVRITRHPGSCALCLAVNSAIVSTSANLSGEPSPKAWESLSPAIASKVDLVLQSRCGNSERPSQIRHLRNGQVIRS